MSVASSPLLISILMLLAKHQLRQLACKKMSFSKSPDTCLRMQQI